MLRFDVRVSFLERQRFVDGPLPHLAPRASKSTPRSVADGLGVAPSLPKTHLAMGLYGFQLCPINLAHNRQPSRNSKRSGTEKKIGLLYIHIYIYIYIIFFQLKYQVSQSGPYAVRRSTFIRTIGSKNLETY